MKFLFGEGIKADVKVKKTDNEYNIVGIRRILVKWVENLIESNANIVSTRAFHNFILNKTHAYDHFYIRSGDESEPIHEKLVDLLLELLIESVYEGYDFSPHFGLYIYDLLRSKIVVSSFA
jgi:hypothetical protein